jgi:hypothetical protein
VPVSRRGRCRGQTSGCIVGVSGRGDERAVSGTEGVAGVGVVSGTAGETPGCRGRTSGCFVGVSGRGGERAVSGTAGVADAGEVSGTPMFDIGVVSGTHRGAWLGVAEDRASGLETGGRTTRALVCHPPLGENRAPLYFACATSLRLSGSAALPF